MLLNIITLIKIEIKIMPVKKYIIANRTGYLLRTDNHAKAEKKVKDLQAANEPYFMYIRPEENIKDTYTKEPGQKNYRVQASKINPGI